MQKDKENKTNNSSVIRVHKTKGYTIISNEALFEKPPLSLNAKGLLCFMLALPENWNYSIDGLVTKCKEGRHVIKSTLKELKERGYLMIEKIPPNKSKTGRFEYIYHIFESKQNFQKQEVKNQPLEFQGVEKQEVEIQPLEIQAIEIQELEKQAIEKQEVENQPNNKELINKLLINKELINKNNKKEKNAFGEFSNVLLLKSEEQKLKTLYTNKFDEAIAVLSNYKEASGKKYKSDYAVLNRSNWVFKKIFPNGIPNQNNENYGKYSSCYR